MKNEWPAQRRAGQRYSRGAPSNPAPRDGQALDAAGLETLARALGGAKRAGDGWSCRCPLHGDRHASLSLGLGEDGRLLLRCHAGCDQRRVFDAVLGRIRELGLLPPPTETGHPKAAKEAATTRRRRTWPAYDARTGELVAEHVREDTQSGKRVWWSKRGVKVAQLALYRADKLAWHRDRPAVVCEGEVATDALAELEDRLGVVAVGTVTGASGTPCDAALEPLRGRTVFLWPDNDDPGRAHMERIARRLAALSVEDIRLVDWRDAAEKDDAADAVAAGVDMAALLEAARRWEPAEAEAGGEGVEGEADGEALDFVDELARRAAEDPGAAFTPEALERLAELKATDRAQWERARARLKLAGVRCKAIDREVRRAALKHAESAPDDGRAEIRLYADDEAQNTRRLAAALDDALQLVPPSLLVRVRRVEKEVEEIAKGVSAERGTLIVEPVNIETVRLLLAERFRFRAPNDPGELAPVPCPRQLAKTIVESPRDVHNWRQITGVAAVPILQDDGSLFFKGIEPRTLVLVDAPELDVPEAPTRTDAERAVPVVLAPFEGYGLEEPQTQACFLAAGLTAAARPSLGSAPLILYDANVAGGGKSKAARANAVIAGGGRPLIVTEGSSDEETEKRIEAALIRGAPAIVLDNLQKVLASSSLESILTEGSQDIRLFGTQKFVTARMRGLILATANNATLRQDLMRRTLPIRLVVLDEAPERRRFDFDPVTRAIERRREILTAAFTILRWWQRELAAGADYPTLGSFEDWARLVAGAVRALTGVDVVDIMVGRRLDDPMVSVEKALFERLARTFGNEPWRASEAIERMPLELWADLGFRTGTEGRPDARSVTAWLRKRRDRILGTMRLVADKDVHGVICWRILDVSAGGAAAGSAGVTVEKPNFSNSAPPGTLKMRTRVEGEARTCARARTKEVGEGEKSETFGFSNVEPASANGWNGGENRADDALVARVADLLAAHKLAEAEGELAAVGAAPGPRTLRDLAAMQDVGAIRLELAALLGGDAS